MSAQAATEDGQRAAESLMLDTCIIRRPSTWGPIDPETGTRPEVPGEIVYGPEIAPKFGRCKQQNQRMRYPSRPDSGDHVFTVGPGEIHVPIVGTESVRTKDIVEITASLDVGTVGRKVSIRIDDRKTFATALRLLIEEVVA